ncbi:hypothetical protein [Oenococcus sp.]
MNWVNDYFLFTLICEVIVLVLAIPILAWMIYLFFKDWKGKK